MGGIHSRSDRSMTMPCSSATSSAEGSKPYSSPSSLRRRWNTRSASTFRAERYRASISCAHLRWRSGSASTAGHRSAVRLW